MTSATKDHAAPPLGVRRDPSLVARAGIVLGTGIYVGLLTGYYIQVVAPAFAYAGYKYHEPLTYAPVVLAAVCALIPGLWMPIAIKRPSEVVYWFVYMLIFVPACVVPFYSADSDPWVIFLRVFCMFIALVVLAVPYRLPPLRLPQFSIPPIAFWIAIGAWCVFAYVLIGSEFGLQIGAIRLSEVDLMRADYKVALGGTGRLVAYVLPWQGNVINPLLVAQGLVTANPFLLAIGLVGQLMIFSITGYKTVLFSGVLVLALLVALRNGGKWFGVYIVWGAIALVVVPWVIDTMLGTPVLSFLFTRRIAAVPGMLTGYYMDFFSEHPHVYLSDSVFRSFVDYPYFTSVSQTIGHTYFTAATNANANLWAHGFANFGWPGIIGMTVGLALVAWVVDGIAQHRDRRLASVLFAVPAFALTNSGLPTSLLTHGIGFAVLLLLMMPRSEGTRARWTA